MRMIAVELKLSRPLATSHHRHHCWHTQHLCGKWLYIHTFIHADSSYCRCVLFNRKFNQVITGAEDGVSWLCNTVQYNTIQYNTVQYNTIQYSTIQYNTILYWLFGRGMPAVGSRYLSSEHGSPRHHHWPALQSTTRASGAYVCIYLCSATMTYLDWSRLSQMGASMLGMQATDNT